ncbi:hypothetical protein K439DRAFT_716379 [Ramaria rubella]|nr:hypothetical protein K439DRAFT_716379 [Ramaria rubella]
MRDLDREIARQSIVVSSLHTSTSSSCLPSSKPSTRILVLPLSIRRPRGACSSPSFSLPPAPVFATPSVFPSPPPPPSPPRPSPPSLRPPLLAPLGLLLPLPPQRQRHHPPRQILHALRMRQRRLSPRIHLPHLRRERILAREEVRVDLLAAARAGEVRRAAGARGGGECDGCVCVCGGCVGLEEGVGFVGGDGVCEEKVFGEDVGDGGRLGACDAGGDGGGGGAVVGGGGGGDVGGGET